MIEIAVAFAIGVSSWSLAEYCIHRWLGHVYTKNLFGKEHTMHHSRGHYFAASWKKASFAVVMAAVQLGLAQLIVPLPIAAAFVAGFSGFYIFYEVLHRLEHVHGGIGRYGRWARRHHFHHHFHNPKKNHGVTSPIWDHVFGTYEQPAVIAVPEKLAMPWLVDPATGDVHSRHQRDYRLRRLARAR